MSSAALYYRHSGRFAPLSLLAVIAVSVILAVAGGAAYGIIVYYMPIIYINALLCVGLGVGLGKLVQWLAIRRHIRNMAAVALTGLLTGLAAEYAAFVGWMLPVSEWTLFVYKPDELFEVLAFVADQGVWGFSKGDPVSGGLLYIFWLVEGLVIVGAATYLAVSDIKDTPYCENCGQWLTDITLIAPLEPIKDTAGLRDSLERGDFKVIGDMKPLGPESSRGRYAEFELRDCPTCDDTAIMSVRNAVVTVDKEGNATRKDAVIAKGLLIDRPSSELIRQLMPRDGEGEAVVADEAPAPAAATQPADDGG